MTPSILSLTFNGLTSLNRAKPEINTSKSETDPCCVFPYTKGFTISNMYAINILYSVYSSSIHYLSFSADNTTA